MVKLLKKISDYKWFLLVSLATVVITTFCDLALPDFMSDIVNRGIMTNDTAYILTVGTKMLAISGLSMAAAIIGSYCSAIAGMGFGKKIRSEIFSKVEYFSQNEFDKFSTASLITRTTNDVNQVQMVIIMGLRMLLSAPITFIGGIIMAMRKDMSLSWIIFVMLPVLCAIFLIMMKYLLPLFKEMQQKIDKLNLVLREKLTGIRVIRAFNRSEKEDKRFSDANEDLADNSYKIGRTMALMMPLMTIIMNGVALLVLWFGSTSIKDVTEVGNLMAFIQYVMQIMMSFMMLAMMFVMIPRAQVSAKRINEVLDTENSVKDRENLTKYSPAMSYRNVIEFKNVSFKYHGANESVLTNISFEAKKGEFIAIIGSTGSGKSTLVNLIPRFYDVTEGSIELYGKDIREIKQKELRDTIGYIPQKAFLFSGTIKSNILEGDESASDEAVWKALQIAQASEFVEKMDDRENSVISQNATNVSGGQKQRLSVARALVKQAPLYIFDDTFSALDFKTDALLRSAIKSELATSCLIVVAQRVGTIMDADKIIVLENGSIVGIGKHDELYKTCDVYKEIVESQLTEEEIA